MLIYSLLGLLTGSLLNFTCDFLPLRRQGHASLRPYLRQRGVQVAWLTWLRRLFRRGGLLPVRGLAVEMATMSLFAMLWQHYGLSSRLLLATLYTCLFVVIFVIDVEHRLILNVITLSATVVALAASLVQPDPGIGNALLGGVVGFGLFYLLAIAYPGAMGAGDVKLAGVIGLMTGYPNVIAALVMGVLVGGGVAVVLLTVGNRDRRSHIPYAPCMVTGAMLTLVYGGEIMRWYAGIMR